MPGPEGSGGHMGGAPIPGYSEKPVTQKDGVMHV
jgi:hypothetical protein